MAAWTMRPRVFGCESIQPILVERSIKLNNALEPAIDKQIDTALSLAANCE
jgi:hypothetical protein